MFSLAGVLEAAAFCRLPEEHRSDSPAKMRLEALPQALHSCFLLWEDRLFANPIIKTALNSSLEFCGGAKR